MPVSGPPPPFDWTKLDCAASIDFFTVFCEVRMPLPALHGKAIWTKDITHRTQWNLTVHDPTRDDVKTVIDILEDPVPVTLEIAVDLKPKASIPVSERSLLLQQTYTAVAGRFRPEDATEWGYGVRGSLNGAGQKPHPFHTRFPDPDQQLIYGHRGDFMQAKAYLKQVDQGAELPIEEHRMRMEVYLRLAALVEWDIVKLSDLLGYQYQRTFAKHFRLIDRPELRASKKRRDVRETSKLETKMARAWRTAGVGKFAPSLDLPADTDPRAARQARARAAQQLSKLDFVLRRDQVSNAKVGSALRQLQRRMRP